MSVCTHDILKFSTNFDVIFGGVRHYVIADCIMVVIRITMVVRDFYWIFIIAVPCGIEDLRGYEVQGDRPW